MFDKSNTGKAATSRSTPNKLLEIDFFRNSIRLLKKLFLTPFLKNLSTVFTNTFSKFFKKLSQKLLIFSSKASFERSLMKFLSFKIKNLSFEFISLKVRNVTLKIRVFTLQDIFKNMYEA